MKKFVTAIIICLVLLLGVASGLALHYRAKFLNIPRESYIDTVKVSVPVPRDSVVVRYITANLPVAPKKDDPDTICIHQTDTLVVHDSVEVIVPITQKVYSEDEYTAWVSGFRPSLDSLELHLPTNVITVQESTPWVEWSFGLQGGMTWVPDQGVKPYVGLGVQIGIPFRKFRSINKHRRK